MNDINNISKNHIFPFLWVHGEDEPTLRNRMEKIIESGIKGVCVESRIHPDFMAEKWWKDMDIIMEIARENSIKVWVLDDIRFPTGRLAGKLLSDFPQHRKWFIRKEIISAVGEQKGASFLVGDLLKDDEDEIVAVVAAKRENKAFEVSDCIEVTSNIVDGILYWDVPQGYWYVFVFVMTRENGEEQTHMNMISKEATRALIDIVYEPHYKHYKEDFGTTFAGFFSDEPQFRNVLDGDGSIGRFDVALPWDVGLLDELSTEAGESFAVLLPGLWVDAGNNTAKARYHYMNHVSSLYGNNFAMQIGQWCRERGIDYVGHVIEDNDIHTQLGRGTGHFFRALWGQDMSGIDVVLQQIIPGYQEFNYYIGFKGNLSGEKDGTFYHYALGKLGASLAHIDEKKKGRAMCEVYGAYGWSEGIKLMKWITDHMLVRGINYFVPHAFTAKGFPDRDCPPHFYAEGKNPQYRYFHILMTYMNQVSELLSDGTHIASAAIIYHAESSWSGDAMKFTDPLRALMENQIDADIVPIDLFEKGEFKVQANELIINKEAYKCLIIPYAKFMPEQMVTSICQLACKGLPIIFISDFPEETCQGEKINANMFEQYDNIIVIPLEQLVDFMYNNDYYDLKLQKPYKFLRSYHYKKNNKNIYMFFNESIHETVKTQVDIGMDVYMYNYRYRPLEYQNYYEENGHILQVELKPYESAIFINSKENTESLLVRHEPGDCKRIISGNWKVSLSSVDRYPKFTYFKEISKLTSLSAPDLLPHFVGTVRYIIEFDYKQEQKVHFIDLGEVYETAQVWLNDIDLGISICPPYQFQLKGALKKGKNILCVEVTNTLAKQIHDRFSIYAMQEPTGLLGDVVLE
ncbi:hypothetical protein SH1V18_39550 [Vallitalea longa]|uniref:Glycoside hydrolase family 2 n=1 Tax=Vallitalea longa TaxID=2936439 RepID=A0A9W5YFC0_9FIRM|nr:glycosylhydrolase-like jelly roll fold domain-containing protein [Vallitalea longa]GKX31475.1 hypothetical protein SH1V18_39550 [Vallitalea longa]